MYKRQIEQDETQRYRLGLLLKHAVKTVKFVTHVLFLELLELSVCKCSSAITYLWVLKSEFSHHALRYSNSWPGLPTCKIEQF